MKASASSPLLKGGPLGGLVRRNSTVTQTDTKESTSSGLKKASARVANVVRMQAALKVSSPAAATQAARAGRVLNQASVKHNGTALNVYSSSTATAALTQPTITQENASTAAGDMPVDFPESQGVSKLHLPVHLTARMLAHITTAFAAPR
jgi:hypothetical protein